MLETDILHKTAMERVFTGHMMYSKESHDIMCYLWTEEEIFLSITRETKTNHHGIKLKTAEKRSRIYQDLQTKNEGARHFQKPWQLLRSKQ